MAPSRTRSDPLPAFHFFIALVEAGESLSSFAAGLGAVVAGGFSECTGLESTIEVEELREGGVNDRLHKFPSGATPSNITLKRGVGLSESLWLWHESFLRGVGVRKNGLVALANEARVPIKVWSFERGIPVKWTGPAFNAESSAAAIESIEIAHEKLELIMSPGKALDAALEAAGSNL